MENNRSRQVWPLCANCWLSRSYPLHKNSSESLERGWIHKETRCKSVTWVNTNKFHWPNCESLLKRKKIEVWWLGMKTGSSVDSNEVKWKWKRPQWKGSEPSKAIFKSGFIIRKFLLYFYLGISKGIIYYEKAPCGQTLNSELYSKQLNRLKEAIAKRGTFLANSRGDMFHQNNTRPYSSILTRQ